MLINSSILITAWELLVINPNQNGIWMLTSSQSMCYPEKKENDTSKTTYALYAIKMDICKKNVLIKNTKGDLNQERTKGSIRERQEIWKRMSHSSHRDG